MTLEDIRNKRRQILEIAERHGVSRVRIFGSLARGETGPISDVDFLIDVEGPTSPWFPGGFVAELETLLGCHVDVVEAEALHKRLRESILREAVAL